MKKQFKAVKFQIKDLNDKTGTFEGYASVFGNRDAGDDIVKKGAFQRSINAKQGHFPILWSHDYSSPPIGEAIVAEDEHGLFVKGTLFIDVLQQARDVYAVMKKGVVDSMSFMYDVIRSESGTIDGEIVRFLIELKLYEVSPVVFAMNELAVITDVKSQEDLDKLLVRIKSLEEKFSAMHDLDKSMTEFKEKMQTDLQALHSKISELAKSGTPESDELADGVKQLTDLVESIKSSLK